MNILNDAPNPAPAADLELSAIEREAAALDTEQAIELNPADPAAQPPEPVDHTADAREIIDFACDSLFPLYPSLEKVYTEPVRQRIAVSGGRLLRKYGVSLADLFGAYGEEIAFAMAVLPVVVPTVQAIRADRAKAEAAAKQPPLTDAPPPPPAAAQADMQARAADAPPAAANPLERFGQ